MTWETFYLVCFLVGFLLSLLSFLVQTGHLHSGGGHVHFQGHADGVHGHADGIHGHDDGFGTSLLAKLNFSTITAFLTAFGGCGYLLSRHTALGLIGIGVAFLVGLAAAWLVFWVLAKVAARDYTLHPGDFEMVGVLGRVTSPLRDGGTGELAFSRAGSRKFVSARSEDGNPIPKDAEVVVTRYEGGIAYVKKWDELTA